MSRYIAPYKDREFARSLTRAIAQSHNPSTATYSTNNVENSVNQKANWMPEAMVWTNATSESRQLWLISYIHEPSRHYELQGEEGRAARACAFEYVKLKHL